MFTFELETTLTHQGEVLTVVMTQYQDNNNTAIALYTEDGELFGVPTVNVIDLPAHKVAIKNYSENQGIEAPLIEAGIIQDEPLHEVPSGFVSIPIYELKPSVVHAITQHDDAPV